MQFDGDLVEHCLNSTENHVVYIHLNPNDGGSMALRNSGILQLK